MHALSSTVTLSFSLSLFLSPISLPRLPSLLVHSTWPSSIRLSRSSLRFVSFSCMLQPRDAPSSAFVLCTYAYTHADTLFYFSPSSLPSLFLSVSLSSFLLLLCPCRVLPLSSFILTLHSQAIRVSFRPARRATSVPPSVLSLCSFSSPISLANLKPLVSLLRHFLPRLLLLSSLSNHDNSYLSSVCLRRSFHTAQACLQAPSSLNVKTFVSLVAAPFSQPMNTSFRLYTGCPALLPAIPSFAKTTCPAPSSFPVCSMVIISKTHTERWSGLSFETDNTLKV